MITLPDNVEVWDLEKDKVLYNLHHPRMVKTVSLGSSGHLLVTSATDHLLRLYDLRRVANEDDDSIQNYTSDYFVAPSSFVEKPNTLCTVLHHSSRELTVWDNVTGTKVECSSVTFFETNMRKFSSFSKFSFFFLTCDIV